MGEKNEIEKRLEELANNLERAKLHEYVDFVNNKKDYYMLIF